MTKQPYKTYVLGVTIAYIDPCKVGDCCTHIVKYTQELNLTSNPSDSLIELISILRLFPYITGNPIS